MQSSNQRRCPLLAVSLVVVSSFFSLAAPAQEEFLNAPASETAPRIDGSVSVAVELLDEPTAVVYNRALKAAPPNRPVDPATRANANALAKRHLGVVKKAQAAVLAVLKDPSINAKVFFATQRTFNGFGVNVASDKIDRIRKIAGVKSVHVMVPQSIDNAGSVPFIGAPAAWLAGIGNNHGEGIRVGVIDTGIDYLHTNFGGPGGGYASNNTTVTGDAPNFPGAKVAGGWDFAGDDYNAGDTAHSTPVPDPDPMDCNGHGSHVAGTIAGYGVRSDGSTFTGPYDGTTPFSSLKIGPGVAPAVQLYALRVFGCSGSTNLTAEAIEWAVDPDGDGDFSDHLDVINMSLGSPLGSPSDPAVTASENAALAGVIVCAAAGNSGDTHYIVGSPGSSPRTITVAASQDNGFPALKVNAPAAIAGLKPIGKPSGWGVAFTDPGITADVIMTSPADACATVTNLSAVAGKIAFVNRGGTCGFEQKAKNAQNAGAVGVIIGNVTTPLIPVTMASGNVGGVTIPAAQLGLDAANEMRTALTAGALVNVTLLRSATTTLDAAGDLVGSFSSRGVRRIDNMLKPDISAPGVAIDSTKALSGNDSVEFNGTSMATPHMAGSMALLRQLHPTWTVEELKALVMNTATHDLFLNASQTPPKYATSRIGAGRVDLANASTAGVVAMNTNGDGSVGVSFGALEVSANATWTRGIQVVNKGDVSQTYAISVANLTTLPGVTYSLPDGNTVTVAAGAAATFRVQLNATYSALRHPLDPSMTSTQSGNFRQYLSEATANVVLTPASGPTLRVPVHAIVRPVAALTTAQSAILMTAPAATTSINLAGTALNTGFGTSDERSSVTAMELTATSPDQGLNDPALRAADIHYVGIASDAKSLGSATTANLYFGISTYGEWTTTADTEFDIYIDTNRDGTFDYVLFTTALASSGNRLDIPVSVLLNLGTGVFTTQNFLNNVGGNVDTAIYNTNVVVVPLLKIGSFGIKSKFDYTVYSFARGIAGSIDSVSGTWDPTHPGVNFKVTGAGAPLFFVTNTSSLSVQYSQTDMNALRSALLFHHLNGDGARDQVLPLTTPSATVTTVASGSGQYSDPVTLTATVSPATFFGQTVGGSVAFTIDGTPAGSAAVSATGVASLPYTIGLPAGAHSVGATFTSTNAFFVNSAGSATLTVSREDAIVVPSSTNPSTVQVSAPGGTAASITLAASVSELADGSAGDIALATPLTITLTPVGPGSPLSQTVSGATATFTNVPVNVYDVSFTIGGAYYSGSASAVLAVFDPSLGNVTGGGTIVHNGVPANFGFNVKYLKNGNAQGSVLYIEHRATGDVKVKSNALDSNSIAGNTSITLGKATVADVGNYSFRLTTVDNGEPGSADQFGLKVSKNNTDVPDLTFAPITLSGGNIQVPKP